MKSPAKIAKLPDVSIRVSGAWALYAGVPVEILDSTCAARLPDAKYSPAFREGRWDGIERLWHADRFPLGLLPDVRKACEDIGLLVEVDSSKQKSVAVDTSRITDGYLPGITLHDYQVEAVLACLKNLTGGGVVRAPTGCHALGQQVMLASGRTRAVEDVRVGDELMGPDRALKRVLRLCGGYAPEMYRVTPTKGAAFEVNAEHMLTLVRTEDGSKHAGGTVDVPVREWLTWSKTAKHAHKLFRASVHFPVATPPILSPYIWGCRSRTKFIPDVLKYAGFYDRRALLAGLLDTDGALSHGCYDYVSKSQRLAEDVVFVARSLGLAAYLTPREKRNQTGFKGRYRVIISGDVRMVPCRMPSKQAKPRRQRKDALRTGFTITPLPGAAFYGFTLTGDGRYLLDDFTVTHNSGKGEVIVAVSKFLWEELGWRTLVVTPKKGLAHQMYLRVKKYVGTDIAVGLLSDGQRIPGSIVIATAQTLMAAWPREQDSAGGKKLLPADPLVRDIVSKFDVVIGDECHHVSSQSWSNVFMWSQAKCRLGFSGTPLKDGNIADLTLKAVTGPILYEVESKVLIGRGVIATPRIVFICADNASSPPFSTKPRLLRIRGQKIVVRNQGSYADVYRKGVVESVEHNATVVRSALWLADRGRKVLVICRRKTHWLQLKAAFTASGVSFLSLWGATKISERERAKKCINDGTISILLASTVFDEGEDAPGIDALVLAEGVKVNTNVIQRIGRALRAKKIDNTAWIVDIVPLAGKKLIEHAFERCKLYEREGYEVRLVEEWPAHTTKEDPAGMLPFETWV